MIFSTSNFDTLYLFKFLVLEFYLGMTNFSKEDKAKVERKWGMNNLLSWCLILEVHNVHMAILVHLEAYMAVFGA